MRLAIHQPQYMPWTGYFHKMASVDCFIFLNDVQFKKNEWQHRNRIRNANGSQWLSVPTTYKFPQKINEVQVDFGQNWQKSHLHSLEASYGKTPFYKQYIPLFAELFCVPCSTIDRINMDSAKLIAGIMGITTEIFKTSDYEFKGESTERLVEICGHFRAKTYLAGAGGHDYMDLTLFEKAGIAVEFQEFHPPVYPQHWAKSAEEFIPGLSAVDLIFNCGPESLKILMEKKKELSIHE
jgi:hypothetical protein